MVVDVSSVCLLIIAIESVAHVETLYDVQSVAKGSALRCLVQTHLLEWLLAGALSAEI